MIPFGPLAVLSLYVGALFSLDASPACTVSPCRDSLVAAPNSPGAGAGGAGSGACEGQTGTTGCRMAVSLAAVADAPRRAEHRHDLPQVQPKVSDVCQLIM